MLADARREAARVVPRGRSRRTRPSTSPRAPASAIWLSPAGSVDAVGLAAQTLYFHKLLTEELGLDVDFLQVGKFKGAEEPFTRDGPSPEARASLEATLVGHAARRGSTGIHAARPAVAAATPEDGPYSATRGEGRCGLVDDVGYFDEARDALEKEAARRPRRGPARRRRGGGRRRRSVRRAARRRGRVARAPRRWRWCARRRHLDGGRRRAPLGGAAASPSATGANARAPRAGRRREGGRAAHRLARRQRARERSPLARAHASPREEAARRQRRRHGGERRLLPRVGGHRWSSPTTRASWARSASSEARSPPTRRSSSIGVHAETFPAKVGDPGAASRAAYESLLMPWDDATRARVLETMTGIYDLFLCRVAEGRGMPVEKRGRVGRGAHLQRARRQGAGARRRRSAGCRDALAKARALAGLPPTRAWRSSARGPACSTRWARTRPRASAPGADRARAGRAATRGPRADRARARARALRRRAWRRWPTASASSVLCRSR